MTRLARRTRAADKQFSLINSPSSTLIRLHLARSRARHAPVREDSPPPYPVASSRLPYQASLPQGANMLSSLQQVPCPTRLPSLPFFLVPYTLLALFLVLYTFAIFWRIRHMTSSSACIYHVLYLPPDASARFELCFFRVSSSTYSLASPARISPWRLDRLLGMRPCAWPLD